MDYHRSSLIKLMSALSQKNIEYSSLPQLESSIADSVATSSVCPLEEDDFEEYPAIYQHSEKPVTTKKKERDIEIRDESPVVEEEHGLACRTAAAAGKGRGHGNPHDWARTVSRGKQKKKPGCVTLGSRKQHKHKDVTFAIEVEGESPETYTTQDDINRKVPVMNQREQSSVSLSKDQQKLDTTITNAPVNKTTDLTCTGAHEDQPQQDTVLQSHNSSDNQEHPDQANFNDSVRNSYSSDEDSIKFIAQLEISKYESVQACPSQTDSILTGENTSHAQDDENRNLIDFSVFAQTTENAKGAPPIPPRLSPATLPVGSVSSYNVHKSNSNTSSKSSSPNQMRTKESSSVRTPATNNEGSTVRIANSNRHGCASASASTISSKHTMGSTLSAMKETIDNPPVLTIKETIDSTASSISAIASSIHAANSTLSASTRRPLPKNPITHFNDEFLKKLLDEEKNRQLETDFELDELLRLVNELQLDHFMENDRQKSTECALWDLVQLASSLQADQTSLCFTLAAPQRLLEAVTEEENSDDEMPSYRNKKMKKSDHDLFPETDNDDTKQEKSPRDGQPGLSQDSHEEDSQSNFNSSWHREDENKRSNEKQYQELKQRAPQETSSRLKLRTPLDQQREWNPATLTCGSLNQVKEDEEVDHGKLQVRDGERNHELKLHQRLTSASSKMSSTTEGSSHVYSSAKSEAIGDMYNDMGSVAQEADGVESFPDRKGVMVRHTSESAFFLDVAKELRDFDRCGLLGFGYVSDYILQLGLPRDLKLLPDSSTFEPPIMLPPTEISIPSIDPNRNSCDSEDEKYVPEENFESDEKSIGNKFCSGSEHGDKSVDWEGIKAILDERKDTTSLEDNNGPKESYKLYSNNDSAISDKEKMLDLKYNTSWEKALMDHQVILDTLNRSDSLTSSGDKHIHTASGLKCNRNGIESSECEADEKSIDQNHSSSWEKTLLEQQAILDNLPDWMEALSEDKCLIDDDSSADTGPPKRKTERRMKALAQDIRLTLSNSSIAAENSQSVSENGNNLHEAKPESRRTESESSFSHRVALPAENGYRVDDNDAVALRNMLATLNEAVANADNQKREIKGGNSPSWSDDSSAQRKSSRANHGLPKAQEVSLPEAERKKEKRREVVLVETVHSDSMSMSFCDPHKEHDHEIINSSWLFDSQEQELQQEHDGEEHSPEIQTKAVTLAKDSSKKRKQVDEATGLFEPATCFPNATWVTQAESSYHQICNHAAYHHGLLLCRRHQRALLQQKRRNPSFGRLGGAARRSTVWTSQYDRTATRKALAQLTSYLATKLEEYLTANKTTCSGTVEAAGSKRTPANGLHSRTRSSGAMTAKRKANRGKFH